MIDMLVYPFCPLFSFPYSSYVHTYMYHSALTPCQDEDGLDSVVNMVPCLIEKKEIPQDARCLAMMCKS